MGDVRLPYVSPDWLPGWLPRLVPEAYSALIAIALLLGILALLLAIASYLRAGRVARRFEAFTTGSDGRSLATALTATVARVDAAEQKLTRAEDSVKRFDRKSRSAVQRVGLVRYSAFDSGGADQSFSLALLDESSNGVVVTSLAGRTGGRLYAKPVRDGRSPHALSTEEQRAIQEAAGGPQTG